MNSVLTENFYAAFPYLYRGHNKPPSESSMYRGFECEDGWYSVLHDLSQELTDYLAQHPDVEIEVMQVKQKLGSLRYLTRGVDAATGEMIERACQRASVTCELTGMTGQLCHIARSQNRGLPYAGPYMVLCPEKAKEFGYTSFFTGYPDLTKFAATCSKALLEKVFMNAEHTQRIENHQNHLDLLLNMGPIKYSNWPPTDTLDLSNSAGVYHFFEKHNDHITSIYIGKGGFGKGGKWSIYKRLKQHFQPSQKYALLGKASRANVLNPEQMKTNFENGNLYLQWVLFATKDSVPDDLESNLKLFECFAIAALNPKYTDA